jgi:very-short-patch-repair endonuclease
VRKLARALRRRSTDAEKLLWSRLRGRRFAGVKFKRQEPIASYIVDFVALDLKLIVEVDGGQHGVWAEQDAERTHILREWGYHVVRFWNNDVLGNIDGVLEVILQEIRLIR